MAGGQERGPGEERKILYWSARPEGQQHRRERPQEETSPAAEVVQLSAVREYIAAEQQRKSTDPSDYANWSTKKKFWYPIGHTLYFAAGALLGGVKGAALGAVIGAGVFGMTGIVESITMGSIVAGFTAATGALPVVIGAMTVAGLIGAGIGINQALGEYYRDFGRKKKRK